MKCRLLVDCDGPNPDYSAKDHLEHEKRGQLYTIHHSRPRTAGTVIEDRKCYRLCLPNNLGVILAEPADDECRQVVAERMNRLHRRQAQIDALRDAQRLAAAAADAEENAEEARDGGDDETSEGAEPAD